MASIKVFLALLFLGIAQQSDAVCLPNQVCNAPRDKIVHADATVPLMERIKSVYRSWTIEPENSAGNIMLAFKNFHTLDVGIVEVTATKFDGSVETMVYSGNRGNFETIATDTWQITINVTLGVENTNFTLFYYADCDIATENPIQNILADEDEGFRKCIIVLPNIQGYINRIYMTLRRINLPEGMHLKVQDVHTSEVVASVTNEEYFETIAVQSTVTVGGINSFFILIDFECSSEECDYAKKEYTISYYAMREKDIWCIEVTKLCNSAQSIPSSWCNVQCPALTNMVEQEYVLEKLPTPEEKTGTDVEERGLRKSLKRRDRACPFYDKSRCQCTRNVTLDLDFCPEHVRCMLQRSCTWRCIVTKITRCIQIRLLEAIKLF